MSHSLNDLALNTLPATTRDNELTRKFEFSIEENTHKYTHTDWLTHISNGFVSRKHYRRTGIRGCQPFYTLSAPVLPSSWHLDTYGSGWKTSESRWPCSTNAITLYAAVANGTEMQTEGICCWLWAVSNTHHSETKQHLWGTWQWKPLNSSKTSTWSPLFHRAQCICFSQFCLFQTQGQQLCQVPSCRMDPCACFRLGSVRPSGKVLPLGSPGFRPGCRLWALLCMTNQHISRYVKTTWLVKFGRYFH